MAFIKVIDNKFYVLRRKPQTKPETHDLDYFSKEKLLDLFWRDGLSFDDKQKLVTYLNARGYNLKLFRGEMRNCEYFASQYWDGICWNLHIINYER